MHRWSAGKLRGFWKLVRDERVISVYAAAGDATQAAGEDWHSRLERAMDEMWASIADDEEAVEFNVARGHIEAALSRFTAAPPAPGWAGFATRERLWFGDVIPASVPDRLAWSRGPALALMLTVLEREQPTPGAGSGGGSSSARVQGGRAERILERAAAARWRHGPRAAERSLELGEVAELQISSSFLNREPDLADRLVGRALDARVDTDLVAGPVGVRLDETAGGVAVRLRQMAREPAP